MKDDEIKINLLKQKNKNKKDTEKPDSKPDTYVFNKMENNDYSLLDLLQFQSNHEANQTEKIINFNEKTNSYEELFNLYEKKLQNLEFGFPLVGKESIAKIPNELSAFFLLHEGQLFAFNPFSREVLNRPVNKMVLPHTVQSVTIYDKRASLEILTILYSDIRIAEELTAYVLFSSNKICLRTQRSFDLVSSKDNQICIFESGCGKPNIVNGEFDLVQISSNEIEWQPE